MFRPPTVQSPHTPPAAVGRFESRGARAGALGALLAAFGLLALLVRAQWAPLWAFDQNAVARLHEFALAHPLFVLAMKAISRAGSGPYYWLLVLALTAWFLAAGRVRAIKPVLFVVVAVGGGQGLNTGVKSLVHRVRPVLADPVEHVGGLSFPSGHAQAAAVGYGVLLVLFWPALAGRGWRLLALAALVAAPLAIGFSRVALGVHYPSDVLGGYLLGAAWLCALLLVFGRLWRPPLLTLEKRTAS